MTRRTAAQSSRSGILTFSRVTATASRQPEVVQRYSVTYFRTLSDKRIGVLCPAEGVLRAALRGLAGNHVGTLVIAPVRVALR